MAFSGEEKQTGQLGIFTKPEETRAVLTRMAESLEDEAQIGTFRRRLHPRYAPLYLNELFTRLVAIYTTQFQISYGAFKHVLNCFDLPAGIASKPQAAAMAYISCWIWDLYASTRECLKKIPATGTSFLQYYPQDAIFIQGRYDPFLQHLNSVIRPTAIPLAPEDALWIPTMGENIDLGGDNPFHITNWHFNVEQVYGLLDTMESNRNGWRIVPLSHDPTGRPMWLLDWNENKAYAWFPLEGHYSKEDLVAAHILGIPCTPKLGPRDVDDWQVWPDNVIPGTYNPGSLERVTPRRFYGSAEYRTVSNRNFSYRTMCPVDDPSKKRKKTTEGTPSITGSSTDTEQETTVQVEAKQYQIIDFTYHAMVVSDLNPHMQNLAIRTFLFGT